MPACSTTNLKSSRPSMARGAHRPPRLTWLGRPQGSPAPPTGSLPAALNLLLLCCRGGRARANPAAMKAWATMSFDLLVPPGARGRPLSPVTRRAVKPSSLLRTLASTPPPMGRGDGTVGGGGPLYQKGAFGHKMDLCGRTLGPRKTQPEEGFSVPPRSIALHPPPLP